MKYKIGIFGSAEDIDASVLEKARELSEVLIKYKNQIILITGATIGLPYEITFTPSKKGTELWGFAACVDKDTLAKKTPDCDLSIYAKLFFIPRNYKFLNDDQVCRKYRNVTSTATCDAGIIVSGRWGSMNEFTNLHDMGKVIGVLTGTGGIADELPDLCEKIHKKSNAVVLFNDSPKILVRNIIKTLKMHHG